MRSNRRKDVAAYIARHRSATIRELCEVFDVSVNTIRADIAFLISTGTVEKVYGGVRSVPQNEVALFTQRTDVRPAEKKLIAHAAAELIRNGDTLFVDAGTTTMNLLETLPPEKHVAVITGNLHLITQAGSRQNIDLIVLPGTLNRRTNSVADVGTIEFLSRYHFAKAILGTTGLSSDGKLNVTSYLEYEIKRLAVKQSDEKILLCDSRKFGNTGLMSYASLSDIDRLITDSACPDELRALCEESGTELIIAGAERTAHV